MLYIPYKICEAVHIDLQRPALNCDHGLEIPARTFMLSDLHDHLTYHHNTPEEDVGMTVESFHFKSYLEKVNLSLECESKIQSHLFVYLFKYLCK